MPSSSPSHTRLAAAAGLLGAAIALAAFAGAGSGPSLVQLTGAVEDVRGNCDEAEHAADPACVGTVTARRAEDGTSSTSSTLGGGSSAAGLSSEARTIRAADAGSVEVAIETSGLRLLLVRADQGWRSEVEQAVGREIEVTFRSGTRRVDLNLELEDGQVRERVRTRDDATDVRTETIDGVVTSDDDNSDPGGDDSSGPGSGSDDDDHDDNSGHGSGSDDDHDDDSGRGSGSDDDDNSGRGSDDD